MELSTRPLEHGITLTVKRLDRSMHLLQRPQPPLDGWMPLAVLIEFLVGILVEARDRIPHERACGLVPWVQRRRTGTEPNVERIDRSEQRDEMLHRVALGVLDCRDQVLQFRITGRVD